MTQSEMPSPGPRRRASGHDWPGDVSVDAAYVRLTVDLGETPTPAVLGRVLVDIEGLYWLALSERLTDEQQRSWVPPTDIAYRMAPDGAGCSRPTVRLLSAGSPLHILL